MASSFLAEQQEEDEEAAAEVLPHVVFFPLPVKGHLNPYLSIAHYLASHRVCVTFIHPSTASSPSFSLLPSLQFQVMPELDLLPRAKPPPPPPHPPAAAADGHGAADNPNSADPSASPFSSAPLRNGLTNILRRLFDDSHESPFCPPCCIFTEGFLPWTHDVALQFGLARVEIWTLSAAVFSMGLHFSEVLARGHPIPLKPGSPEAEKMLDFIPGVPPLRVKDLPVMLTMENEELRTFVLQAFERCKEADRVLVNTFYELEGEAIDALREVAGVRMEVVGPLSVTTELPTRLTEAGEEEDIECMRWLDDRAACSVVYVSFGSLATLEAEAVRELALGLEATKQAFLWALRPGALGGHTLPEGFEERTRDRGRIVSWAPQLGVLAHPAVGAFVTHCGWNSTMEALAAGVPMIGLPMLAEQNTNLHFLADVWHVAIRLTSDYHFPVSRDGVEECVRCVMTGTEEGRRLREKAVALRKLARQSPTSKATLRQLVHDLHFGKLGRLNKEI